ncbi:MAG: hypothetical protein EBV11_05740 [Actinobacteria bacterium]|jgi:hypothetical protein|nr:hypothetical protein [Actinomycetota bacterium]
MNNWKVFGEEQLRFECDPILSDIDLDQEVVIVDGQRLTEAGAEVLSEEIMEAFYHHHGLRFAPRKISK